MSKTGQFVLTIGHSTHDVDTFLSLLQRCGVTAVADVRAAPYSRFNPQFNRESLAKSLAGREIEYVFLGRELGGRSNDPAMYDNGRIRYDRVALTPLFAQGLQRIARGATEHRVALMCAEKEPLECHRGLLVAPELEAQGIAVRHILADGRMETHTSAMERLLNMHGDSQQRDLFLHPDERIGKAISRQAERFAHRIQAPATVAQPVHEERADYTP